MSETMILFANPSFIEGMARIMDLGATLEEYNESKTGDEADYFALRNDWKAIGKDYIKAIEIVEQEIHEQKTDKKPTLPLQITKSFLHNILNKNYLLGLCLILIY